MHGKNKRADIMLRLLAVEKKHHSRKDRHQEKHHIGNRLEQKVIEFFLAFILKTNKLPYDVPVYRRRFNMFGSHDGIRFRNLYAA